MDQPASLKDLEGVFSNVVSAILPLAGIVLFILLIIGGFNFISSGGDPKKTEVAQKTISTAIMGFILVASAYLILVLIEKFTGVKVTEFKITR